MNSDALPRTLGELKAAGYALRDVKQEMRLNLIRLMREGVDPFPGILGYEETVIPQLSNAILARHDILLLGLRGQAKTRMARLLVNLLDEYVPCVAGCPLRSDPFAPLTKHARERLDRDGDATELEWIHRAARYQEKLATPDVSIADLIGDVDPIKAVSRKLDLSDEEVIHYGIIPRANRGIFCINELPDLQARIQVGLLNILEEKDVQIRGFPIRMPLDLAIVFTANPEDYTNRGNIITPLKDRIDAQILTHYPTNIEVGMAITAQEAWVDREGAPPVVVLPVLRELVELTAIEARSNDYVDKNSGVSARMPIALYETLMSAAERRAVIHGEDRALARVHDLYTGVPAISGKVELVYKGEQEGIGNVAFHLVGRAVRSMFNHSFIPDWSPENESKYDFPEFKPVVDWFEEGRVLDLGDSIPYKEYVRRLKSVDGLERIAREKLKPASPEESHLAMEFILEGLHQNFLLSKQLIGSRVSYSDSLSSMIGD
jgi:magnesium chelatase subunit I